MQFVPIASVNLTQLAPKAAVMSEIKQNDGYLAIVQGHQLGY